VGNEGEMDVEIREINKPTKRQEKEESYELVLLSNSEV
jgi:hypothetical protein